MSLIFVDPTPPTSGLQNGLNQAFTVANAPNPTTSFQVFLNGVLQKQGTDYTLAGSTFTFAFAFPIATDELLTSYRYDNINAAFGGLVTFGDLFRSSFRCISRLLPGFKYAPNELTDCLFICNSMLDGWAADDLNAPWTLIQSFPLTPGKGSYSVGPGGDFNGARPTRLTKATLVVMTNPAQPLRIDLGILNADQWQSINLQLTASTLTQRVFYNPTGPLGTANFWPVPTEADYVEFSSMQSLAGIVGNITADTTAFIAPPGYQDAVRYNLAVRLAMEWPNITLKPGVAALAIETLAVIQRSNAPTPQMQCNPGVMPTSETRSGWSRLTGDFLGD